MAESDQAMAWVEHKQNRIVGVIESDTEAKSNEA